MTKDEAIRILKNAAWLGSNDEREATEEAVDLAVDVLKDCDKCARASINAITLLQNTIKEQWIPCSERLPEEYDEYLCQDADGDRFVGWLEDAEWCKQHVVKWDIVAWMPLPKKYKRSNERPCTVASANVESYGESY